MSSPEAGHSSRFSPYTLPPHRNVTGQPPDFAARSIKFPSFRDMWFSSPMTADSVSNLGSTSRPTMGPPEAPNDYLFSAHSSHSSVAQQSSGASGSSVICPTQPALLRNNERCEPQMSVIRPTGYLPFDMTLLSDASLLSRPFSPQLSSSHHHHAIAGNSTIELPLTGPTNSNLPVVSLSDVDDILRDTTTPTPPAAISETIFPFSEAQANLFHDTNHNSFYPYEANSDDDDDVVFLGRFSQRGQAYLPPEEVDPDDVLSMSDIEEVTMPHLEFRAIAAFEREESLRRFIRYRNGEPVDGLNTTVPERGRPKRIPIPTLASYRMTKKKFVSGMICSICLDDLAVGRLISPLSCKHEFHSNCIRNWLKKSTTCPNCRKPV